MMKEIEQSYLRQVESEQQMKLPQFVRNLQAMTLIKMTLEGRVVMKNPPASSLLQQ